MCVECPCLQKRQGEGAHMDASALIEPAREWTSISSEVGDLHESPILHLIPSDGPGLCLFSAVFTAVESVYVTQM